MTNHINITLSDEIKSILATGVTACRAKDCRFNKRFNCQLKAVTVSSQGNCDGFELRETAFDKELIENARKITEWPVIND